MNNRFYLLAMRIFLCFSLVFGITITYGQSKGQLLVPQNYPTIQAGINAAGIGDTVLVSQGIYNENINYNGKPVMVASQYLLSGDSAHIIQTIIDGNNLGPVVTFNTMETENSLLVGFTLRDGNAVFGGGIYCENADPVLSNLIIKNCNADYGGGIYLYESMAYIWRVALTGNHATYYGGAVSCDTYSYPALYNMRILNNSAQYGGGVHCYLSDPYIAEFEIYDNSAEYGAGIYLYQSSPYIWEGRISGNTAVNYGGGIECDYYSQPVLSFLQINNNTSLYGAGLHLSFSDALVLKSTIASNQSDFGGGIYCYYSYPGIKNTVVAFNQGQYGIYCYEGIPQIEYSNFYENEQGNFYNTGGEIGSNVQTNVNGDSCDIYFNIQKNPFFIDPVNQDYHLLSSSNSIDAGDPDSPEDADGSIADIGRYYYHQSFVANFSADITYGLPLLTVQFTDESTGNPNSYAWDFNNDGVIDSNDKNPQWTYEEMGDYSVVLNISRSILNHQRMKEDYIKVFYIPQPDITEITDVPGDQGGWVTVSFLRSVHDTDTLADKSTESYTIQYNTGSGWVSVNSAAAYGEDEYSVLCHTPFDSVAGSSGLIDFRVIASMDEGNFVSSIKQGYSVDNLSPGIPGDLLVEIIGEDYSLSWQPADDPDLQYYAVFVSSLEGGFGDEPDYYAADPFIENLPVGDEAVMLAVRAVDYSGNESALTEPVDAPMTMAIELNKGWNSLSGYIAPDNMLLEEMFSGLESELIFLNNLNGYWYPDQNQNTLIDWDVKSGYQVKLAGEAVMSITGFIEREQTLQLNQGWNLIPVLSNCPVQASLVFEILKGKAKIIKAAAGLEVLWPEMLVNNLHQLMPGKAYLIYMNENADFVFPDCQ
jgi:PKD repeat protein